MDSRTRICLIRHGEVEQRYHRVFGGRIDMELSPIGHQQAEALAKYLDRLPFSAIYASPMKRVRQTLQQLLARQDKAPVYLEELREVDFGSWTGLAWEEIDARFGVSAFQWLAQLERGSIHQAEPVPAFRRRIELALERVLKDCPGQTVALVCHGGVIRMILAVLLDLPLRSMAGFDFEYASLTILEWLPGKAEVQLLNFTPWRDHP
jgi:broad specificity phosphatase PhoE